MNYFHAFHAGNHGDVLKHAVVALVLQHLKRKASPFFVLDTHAGAGAYDLRCAEAKRSPEWVDGVGRVWDWPSPPEALAPYLSVLRNVNPDGSLTLYPGSPRLILELMRDGDRLAACDLHPKTAESLKAHVNSDPRAQPHLRDGYEAMKALLPPPERRGLVLLDPPYEDRTKDLAASTAAICASIQRFSGAYVWWRPLKSMSELDKTDTAFMAIKGVKAIRTDLAVDDVAADGPMTASSVMIFNPPFTLAADLRALLPPLAARLSRSAKSGWRIRVFGEL
jgi:23S rRNA (adenine2030-N6)-methyltransferase